MGSLLTSERQMIALAAAEGHDADIPSNKGAVPPAAESANHHDIEKHADSIASKAPSCHSANEENNERGQSAHSDSSDPNTIFWDSETDPKNPMNWSGSKKWSQIALVSMLTFLSPLASSLFVPGVPQIMREFNSQNQLLEGFVVSVFVLGYAFGPLLVAPLSEIYGRLPVYHICNFLFVIANVACALSTSLNMLVVFRFLAGCFGASPLALGGGTIADLMPPHQRAKAMSLYTVGPTLGPIVGPMCGGFIAKYVGWRWCFYVLAIAIGIASIFCLFFLRETYAPLLLERKVKKLIKATGNLNLKSKLDVGLSAKDLFWFSIARPTKMLLFSPICLFLSSYVALAYAYLYMLFTTMTTVMESRYHIRSDLVGLTFIGMGIGQFGGQFLYSYIAGRQYSKKSKEGLFKPEQRLPPMYVGSVCIPIGLFCYGWSVQAGTFWLVPILGTTVFTFGLIFIWLPVNVYLIDVFTRYAASAMAANTVLRSVVAAILPLATPPMYKALGYGWGDSLLAFIAILLAPMPYVFIKYGERLRTKSTLKL